MRTVLLAGSLFAAVFAQEPGDLFTKAPPAVDEALRARIQKFYEAHRDGKFRVADTFVAEDSKDTFFESDKRRCKTFDIAKITYSEDFTKADVLTLCQTTMLMPPKGMVDLKLPLASKWKVEGGEWFWYVIPQSGRESPFGKMFPGAGEDGGIPNTIPKGPNVAEVMRMVKTDKNVVAFRGAAGGVEQVTISSALPGEAQISVQAAADSDLKFSLDKKTLKSAESATLTVEYTPNPAKPRRVPSTQEFRIQVDPLNRQIPIQITFN